MNRLIQTAFVAAIASLLSSAVVVPSEAYATEQFFCQPSLVMERSNRLEVLCSNSVAVGGDTVSRITYAKTDEPVAERFFRAALSAFLAKKRLYVELPDDGSGNLNGCSSSECRTVTFPFAVDD